MQTRNRTDLPQSRLLDNLPNLAIVERGPTVIKRANVSRKHSKVYCKLVLVQVASGGCLVVIDFNIAAK